MGSMSIWHWILVLAVGLLLFGGRGKISELMGDFAKGIKSFKKGLTEEEKAETEPVKTDPRSELLLIGIVALIAIGPKELPTVLRTLGQWMSKLRRMASEFQNQFQEAMREAEMADLKKQVDEMTSQAQSYANFDPVGEVRRELESTQQQIENSMASTAGAAAPSPPVTAEPDTSPAGPAPPVAPTTDAAAPSSAVPEPATADAGAAKPDGKPA